MSHVVRILVGTALVLFLGGVLLFPPVAAAQGPIPLNPPSAAPPASASTTNLDDPARATAIGSATQAIQPGTAQWYKFDYTTQADSLPRPQVTIELLNGVANGLDFEVYAPEQIQNIWYDHPPTGHASQQVLPPDCGNTSPDISGPPCTTNNRIWIGGLGVDGTVYIRVINNTNNAVAPQLIVAGGNGLAACQTASQPAAQAQASGTQPYTQLQCSAAPVLPGTPAGS